MENVKFVNNDANFVECSGRSVSLYTVDAYASGAIVECTAASAIDAGDYLIIPTPTTTYYAWMDKNGDGTTQDPAPAGYDTDAGIQVDISGATTAANVATALYGAIDGVTGLSATVSNSTGVDIDVDDAGACDAISDYSCGFTLSSVVGGKAANGLLKSAVPNNDTTIVEVFDATYSSDDLVVIAKTKTKTAVNSPLVGLVGSGYDYTYAYEVITHSNFVLG